ncbi:hypothetical protein [uncultured Sphingomonas sp.]|uniref:hypothetical protein n=1 Tax=uncultured Sphingomonas sp. TaxID=158754 RepID=UPI0025FF0904|nr:hypothetical protein [uncultured Sphingomonas sp.]
MNVLTLGEKVCESLQPKTDVHLPHGWLVNRGWMMTGLSKSAWLIACATLALVPSMTAAQTSAPTPSAAQAPDRSGDASLDIVVTAHIDSGVGSRGLPDVAQIALAVAGDV